MGDKHRFVHLETGEVLEGRRLRVCLVAYGVILGLWLGFVPGIAVMVPPFVLSLLCLCGVVHFGHPAVQWLMSLGELAGDFAKAGLFLALIGGVVFGTLGGTPWMVSVLRCVARSMPAMQLWTTGMAMALVCGSVFGGLSFLFFPDVLRDLEYGTGPTPLRTHASGIVATLSAALGAVVGVMVHSAIVRWQRRRRNAKSDASSHP